MSMPARKIRAISARVAQLRRRHQSLAAQIEEELQRPAPCSAALQRLKRQRLRLKDQIARYTAQSSTRTA